MSADVQGNAFQERNSSTPKLATSTVLFSTRTHVSFSADSFRRQEVVIEWLLERNSSSPKLATMHFLGGEVIDGTLGMDLSSADVFGNAITNQRFRGGL